MNYIKEIEAFEDWLEINYLPATAQLLWYKLLVLCNRAGWAEWLSVTNQALMAKIGASSEKTLIEARNRLKQAGLIDFKTGKKGQPTKYKLFSVYEILQNIHCKKYTVKNTVNNTVENTPFPTVKDTVNPTVKDTVKASSNSEITSTPEELNYKLKTKTKTNINIINNSSSKEEESKGFAAAKEITAQELIAELTKFYQHVTGSTDKKDYPYIGGLYNKFGYDEVWNAIDTLRLRLLTQPVENPRAYLAGILNNNSLIMPKEKKEEKKGGNFDDKYAEFYE